MKIKEIFSVFVIVLLLTVVSVASAETVDTGSDELSGSASADTVGSDDSELSGSGTSDTVGSDDDELSGSGTSDTVGSDEGDDSSDDELSGSGTSDTVGSDDEDDNNGGGGSSSSDDERTVSGGGIIRDRGQVLGAATDNLSCGIYLLEYLRYGHDNNPVEVIKLQDFLNEFNGADIEVTGIFDLATEQAVKDLQAKYPEILSPWGIYEPTGIVYITTKDFINRMKCDTLETTLPSLTPWSGKLGM